MPRICAYTFGQCCHRTFLEYACFIMPHSQSNRVVLVRSNHESTPLFFTPKRPDKSSSARSTTLPRPKSLLLSVKYRHRPPYPQEVFALLASLVLDEPRAVLDVG